MCSAAEARIKDPDAPADEFFPILGERISLCMFRCKVFDEKVDVGVVKLGCHKKVHPLDETVVDQVNVHQGRLGER